MKIKLSSKLKTERLITLITTIMFLLSTTSVILASDDSAIQITNVQVISETPTPTQSPTISSMNGYLGNRTDSFSTAGEDITIYINVNATDNTSTITNVSIDCTTPNGEQTLNLIKLSTSTDRWVVQKNFISEDIGVWTINKVTAIDSLDNIEEKSFSNYKFYVLPSNFSLYNSNPLGINNSTNTVKISFSREADINTINNESILLFETTGNMILDFSISNDYNLKQLTDYSIVVSNDKKSMNLKYNLPYESNKQYHIIVKDSIKDLDGNSITNPMWINFQYVSD